MTFVIFHDEASKDKRVSVNVNFIESFRPSKYGGTCLLFQDSNPNVLAPTMNIKESFDEVCVLVGAVPAG